MEDIQVITTGHWIFAGIFAVVFAGFLIWSYRKDAQKHKSYGMSSFGLILIFIVALITIFIFKRLI